MTLIDREGRFRGRPVQWAMKKSSGGFPQFNVSLQALEHFDESVENEDGSLGAWIDWSEYDQGMTGYFVLFNADKPMLNYEQIQKVFGWDGTDFGTLQGGSYDKLMVQFIVEPNEYKGKTSLRINWIGEYDENPVFQLVPLDTNALTQLGAQVAHLMTKKSTPKAAPAKAKAPKKAKAVAGPPKVKKQAVEATALPNEISKEKAWDYLVTNRDKDAHNDNAVANAWIAGCDRISERDDSDEDDFTLRNWAEVMGVAAEILEIA